MLGTPLYMSPEQVVGAKHLDHRADLWSIGVVLYEALSGATPHGDAETLGALLVGICSKPALSLRELAPEVSEPVVEIVMKSLSLDPAQRYATADELLADIKLALGTGIGLDVATLEACPINRLLDDDEMPYSATSFAET
jgi:serine/threonine-protein kinase